MPELSILHYIVILVVVFFVGYYCIGRFGQWHKLHTAYAEQKNSQLLNGTSFSLAAFRLGYISYKSSVNMAVDGDCLRIFMQPGFGLGHPQISAIPLADIEAKTRQTAIGDLVELRFAKAPGIRALISTDVANKIVHQSRDTWWVNW
ncbi:hypothetical protein [Salinibius halmophilus]|uniref:hypothetical protein n=1 Tax=Salinibius halmophilus TaxID=1853216 RepID=UPI000E66801E|nr:hypothetical protein [Salinibius halmophilus]